MFNDIVAALRPDIYTAIADDVPSTAGRKRCATSVKRTALWLQACLSARLPVATSAGIAKQPSAASEASAAASRDTAPEESRAKTLVFAQHLSASPSAATEAEAMKAQPANASLEHGQQGQQIENGQRGKPNQLEGGVDPLLTAAHRNALGSVPLLASIVGGRFPDERRRSAQLAAATPGISGFALAGAQRHAPSHEHNEECCSALLAGCWLRDEPARYSLAYLGSPLLVDLLQFDYCNRLLSEFLQWKDTGQLCAVSIDFSCA